MLVKRGLRAHDVDLYVKWVDIVSDFIFMIIGWGIYFCQHMFSREWHQYLTLHERGEAYYYSLT